MQGFGPRKCGSVRFECDSKCAIGGPKVCASLVLNRVGHLSLFVASACVPTVCASRRPVLDLLLLPQLAEDSYSVLELNYPEHYYVQGKRKPRSWTDWLWPFD